MRKAAFAGLNAKDPNKSSGRERKLYNDEVQKTRIFLRGTGFFATDRIDLLNFQLGEVEVKIREVIVEAKNELREQDHNLGETEQHEETLDEGDLSAEESDDDDDFEF
jgi:hypothetical protein